MTSFLFRWLLLVLSGIESVVTVRLVCSGGNPCIMHDLSKTSDYFMYQYAYTNVTQFVYHNLLLEHIDGPFFDEIGKTAKQVNIIQSKVLKTINGLVSPNISHLQLVQTGLHSAEFEENNTLITLIISFSNLVAISPTINMLRASRRIEISHAFLQAIDFGVFCDLSNLRSLNFIFNRVQHITNSAVKECSFYNALHYLYLSQNELKTINMELFSPFSSVIFMNFRYNALETLTGCFTNAAPFIVEFAHNRLKELDLCSWHLPKVIRLNLNSNLLSSIPKCIDHLTGVSELIIENNLIVNVSMDAFANLDSLQQLNLSYNNMSSIEISALPFPKNLKTLELAGNKLTALDLSSIPMQSLSVNVQGNLICRLDAGNMSPNVTFLDMKFNPTDCSWHTREDRGRQLVCVNNSRIYC